MVSSPAQELNTHSLAWLMWAMASRCHYDEQLCTAAAAAAAQLVPSMHPGNMSQLVWAFSQLKTDCTAFLVAAAEQVRLVALVEQVAASWSRRHCCCAQALRDVHG